MQEVKHLGNVLQTDNTMTIDATQKRDKMIGKVNSLLQEFYAATPDLLMKLLNVYATSLYGSCLWDLMSTNVEKILTSWNVTVRNVLKLDRCTHRYLIEPLSNCPHLMTLLLSRFANFYKSLLSTKKSSVRYLVRTMECDLRTVLGRTLLFLRKETNLTDQHPSTLTSKIVKANIQYKQICAEDQWKINMAKELIDVRDQERMEIEGFTESECKDILKYLCTS